MLDTLVQSILMILGLGSSVVPIASAGTMEAQPWSAKDFKSVYSVEEDEKVLATSYLSRDDLFVLTHEELYWVVAILDGDTLLVSGPDRELFQVRLLAVDTNEINGPDSTAECYGYEAALFTMEFLKDRAVRLTADPANKDEDPYGRKLRYVDVLQQDGSFLPLNEALLREGYASFPEEYPVTDPEKFSGLEKAAKAQGKGLWEACKIKS